ncbi:hypothetical protein JOD45_001052 [Scopulibacillus daqui]|uniref:Uncharacterized protein n=1 Tax=Scopulibacillus daqui TaxID=1469162 RepID=A0ABS2PYQ8_9BACL|nr:hypothetical protein [Scopulibacillus daqui]
MEGPNCSLQTRGIPSAALSVFSGNDHGHPESKELHAHDVKVKKMKSDMKLMGELN